MAENLVRYGFQTEKGRSVEEIINEVSNLINGQSSNNNDMREFINELIEIKKRVELRERLFYNSLGVSDFSELNKRLQDIEESYKPFLAGGKAIQTIQKTIDFASIGDDSTPEEIEAAIALCLEEFMQDEGREEMFLSILQKELGDGHSEKEIIDNFIQTNLRVDKLQTKSGKSGRFILSKGGTSVGLGKLIVKYDKEKKKFVLNTENIDFSPAFKKRLSDLLEIMVPQKVKKRGASTYTSRGFRQRINEIALSTITNDEARGYIKQAMDNKKEFDIKRNLYSVIGYLGEIRAVAMLKQITKDNPEISTRGTGALRDAIKGQEIPIDVVCAACGFQIKNYTIIDQKVTFSNETWAPYMLSSRMNLTGSLYEIILSLFGVYQYNQPFHKPSNVEGDWETPNLQEYIEMYNEIYSDSNSLFYRLKPIFDSRVPYMIKMAQEFSVNGDNDFMSQSVYFNTFYWINKKLVPSSYILEQLINQLRNKTETIISTVYTLSEPMTGYTLQKLPKLVGRQNMYDAADHLRMSYDITIDLSKIV